jgi:hypothetical protein
MDLVSMLKDSYEYTKDALWGNWGRWLILLISTIIFPLIYGYAVRIMRGTEPAPEADNLVSMFVEGIVLLVIYVIYVIPIFLISFLSALLYFVPVSVTSGPATTGDPVGSAGLSLGLIVAAILAVVIVFLVIAIALISYFGVIRYARTGRFGEAFNLRAITRHIGEVGWLSYFAALVIYAVVVAIVEFVLILIPVIGWLILFVLMPAFVIFSYRYVTLIYDSAPAPA